MISQWNGSWIALLRGAEYEVIPYMDGADLHITWDAYRVRRRGSRGNGRVISGQMYRQYYEKL